MVKYKFVNLGNFGTFGFRETWHPKLPFSRDGRLDSMLAGIATGSGARVKDFISLKAASISIDTTCTDIAFPAHDLMKEAGNPWVVRREMP